MRKLKKTLTFGIVVLTFCGLGVSPAAFGHSGFGLSPFGGALRGATRVTGRVLCLACTLKDAQAASPQSGADLYVFENGAQHAVFQVTAVGKIPSGEDPSQLAYWIAITGLRKKLIVRTKAQLWQNLTTAENMHKEVELTGLLRSTGTFDVAVIAPADAQ